MKNTSRPQFMIDDARPRVQALVSYYDRLEKALGEKVLWDPKRYPMTPGTTRNSPVSMWLSCADADVIIEEAGLVNPFFEDEKERE